MNDRTTKWLSIEKGIRLPNKKTDLYGVYNKESGACIGLIKWYGAFRQYSFFPASNTVYEKTCLADISKFMQDLMDERKIEKDKALNYTIKMPVV